jgi:HSP20 family molecular chaperone IbpA
MSFLEKLQKGMQNQQTDAESQGNEIIDSQDNTEGQPEKGTAVFASYKSTPGPAEFKESNESKVKKTKMRGRPKRLITADNVEEMTDLPAEFSVEDEILQTKENIKNSSLKTMTNKKTSNTEKNENTWLSNEGQLAVNVYQTENDLVLQTAIAGIKVDDLDVLIEDDVITIKGNRPNPLGEKGDYFIEECYWGPFARKVILPVEVDSSRADAAMKEGILTIRIPKIQREKKKKLTIKE